jgi:hypothetical protein
MAYRAPNTYARFVKTAGTVNSAGAARVMGLIGTGLNYYEIYNEPVQKNSDRPYDALVNSNVFEIISVSQKPYISGKDTTDNKLYKKDTDFTVEQGKYLAWKMLQAPDFEIITPVSAGAEAFRTNVEIAKYAGIAYLAEDGEYIVEVTYVSPTEGAGTYRVINNLTKETIGEYAVSSTGIDVIPGFKLKVTSTYAEDTDGTALINVGDYIKVVTTAGLTQLPASVTKLGTVSDIALKYNEDLADAITELSVNNFDTLADGIYTMTITSKTNGTFIVTDASGAKLYEGIVGGEASYPEVIPGVTFKLPTTLASTILDNDAVSIEVVKNENKNVPVESSVYYVSYKYKKPEDGYEPKIFFDYDDIVAEYGNYDVTVSGIIANSLALGAEIAFLNGITPIVCVQAKNDSDYEITAALNKLQRLLPGVDNINTIVPLTDSATVGAAAIKHCDIMSDSENGKERMVYLGAARSQPITKIATVLDKSLGMVETAKSYNNERAVYVVPGEITKDIRDLRTGRTNERKLPACYAAVAVAALGLRNDPAEPLTNKNITGFKNLTSLYMESEKNFLAAAGCLVLEQNGSIIKVRHGITTSTAEVESAEITLIQIKDYVIDACRKSTASLYIGNKNRPSIVSDVQYTISSLLNQFVSQSILLGYSGLTVKRSKEDPRQIDVKFEIEAVYPLNYISITFGFAANS